MPLYTQGALSVGYTQDDIEATPEDVRSATFEQAKNDLPGWSIFRAEELAVARKYGGLAFPDYSPDAARQYMAERGLEGQFKFDRTYNGDELRILASRKQAELKRSYILSRAEGGFAQGAGRLGIQLATSFLDPLAIATAFVPVVGEARYTAMLAKAGGALGRAGVRVGVGAAEGAVGAALVEPIIYAAKAQEQADYSLADSMLNIALGGVFGGGLHAVGGAIGDIGRTARETAAQARVAEFRRMIDEHEALNAPAPYTPLVEVERRLTVDDISAHVEDLYTARVAELQKAIEGDMGPEQPILGMTRRQAAESELKRLESAWNRAKNTEDRAKILDGQDGPLWKSLVDAQRADNLTAVEARLSELQDARPQAEAALRAAEAQPESGIAGGADIREQAIRDASRELRKIDAELFQLNPIANTLRDQLKDVAAIKVLRASPAAREAALGVGMAQIASGEPVELRPIFERGSWQEAARRLSDPDQREMANAASVQRGDAVLAEGEPTEAATLQRQVEELDSRVKAIEQEAKTMGDESASDHFAELREIAAALEKEATESSDQARMLVVCAMRHAA